MLLTRFTRYVPPTLNPPEGASMVVLVADVASTKESSTWSFTGMTDRSVLVRTTVKLVGSVSTRTQARVFEPVEVQDEELEGCVTWNACTESAPLARIARRLTECIVVVLVERRVTKLKGVAATKRTSGFI